MASLIALRVFVPSLCLCVNKKSTPTFLPTFRLPSMRLYPVFLLLLWLLPYHAHAQGTATDKQLKDWLKTLSAKQDPKAAKLNQVLADFRNANINLCDAIPRFQALATSYNIRAQIRSRLIIHLVRVDGDDCPNYPDDKQNLLEALQLANEIEDPYLQFEIYLRLEQVYNRMKLYGQGTLQLQLLFESVRRGKRENFILDPIAFYDLSFGLYQIRDYKGSIKYGLNGLMVLPNPEFIPEDTLNYYQRMVQWNTIGLCYQKLHQPDSAFLAFHKADSIAQRYHESAWQGFIKGNMGDVYFDLQQYDSAYTLLQYDVDKSVAAGIFDNAANSLQWLARIDLQRHQLNPALQKLRTASHYLKKSQQPKYQSNLAYTYAMAFIRLGVPDSAEYFMTLYQHLHDSLENVATNSRMEMIQLQMDQLDHEQKIKILNRQKQKIALSRNFSIILVILLASLAYMIWNRMRSKLALKQKQAAEEKRLAQEKAQQAIDQLETYRQYLVEKNTLIEHWQSAYADREASDDLQKKLSDLSQHIILNEEDWDKFKKLFESVYPGFFLTLRNIVPDITQAEQRMAALIKLQLTARESANLLGVSANSVYKTKQRLRDRFNLQNEDDLEAYVRSL